MKKIALLLTGMLLLASSIFAESVVGEPGKLSESFGEGEGKIPLTVTELTITGEINVLDFDFIRSSLTALETLDISGASIVYYKGATSSKSDPESEYLANELPEGALKSSRWSMLALKTVVLPGNLTTIGKDAFFGSSNIISAGIPSTVTKIGAQSYYNTAITSITIPSGVDTIHNGTFQSVATLEKVWFSYPSSLKYIGGSAFNTTGMTGELTLPEGLDSIDNSAFYYNVGLTSVKFPASLRGIANNAFAYSSGITKAELNDGLEYLGGGVFDGCENIESLVLPSSLKGIDESFMNSGWFPLSKLTAIYSYMENPVKITDDTFSDIDKDACTLYIPFGTLAAENYDVTGWRKFTKIAEMKDLNATEATVMSQAGKLEQEHFSTGGYSQTITSLTISGEINALDFYFIRTKLTALETLDISEATIVHYNGTIPSNPSTVIDYPTNELPEDALSGHKALKTVSLPSNLTAIGASSFFNITTLATVDIPWDAPISKIGKSAFYKTAITSITIPAEVDTIQSNTFQDCAQLTTVWFDNYEQKLKVIDGSAFSSTNITGELTLPEGLDSIGNSAFYYNPNLTSVKLPTTLRAVGNNAFKYTGLTEVVFPEGFKHLYATAFANTSVATIVLPSTMEYINVAAFHQSASRSILASVKTIFSSMIDPINIDAKTFNISASQRVQNATLYVPKGATANYDKTGWDAFGADNENNNKIVEIDQEATELTFVNTPGGLSSNFGESRYPSTITKLTLTGEMDVRDFDFIRTGLTNLTELNIKDASIVYYKGATSAKFEPENEYFANELPEDALRSSRWSMLALKTVLLPTNLTSIGKSAFSGSSTIISADIPSNVTKIGSGAFYKTSITSVTIPNGVDTIQSGTFQDVATLQEIWFSNQGNLKLIGGSAFNGTNITGLLELPAGLDSIGGSAFYYNPEMTAITFPTSLRGIANGAFAYNTGLTKIELNEGLEYLNYGIFNDCENLENITLPSSLKGIDESFMNDDSPLTRLTAIYSYMEDPVKIISTTFDDVNKTTCTLYIPLGTSENYDVTGWRDFTIREMPSVGISDAQNKPSFALQGGTLGSEAHFVFEVAGVGASITIYDVKGKAIATETVEAGSTEVTVSVGNLPSGIYIARYSDNSGKQATVKLVK